MRIHINKYMHINICTSIHAYEATRHMILKGIQARKRNKQQTFGFFGGELKAVAQSACVT